MNTSYLPTTVNAPYTAPTSSGAATSIVEPKAFHRQGQYRNNWHRFWQFVLPILGTLATLTALGLTIAGAVLIGKHASDILDSTGTSVVLDTNKYEALWIINAALLPVLLLSGLLTFIFSLIAMRHEHRLTRFNNDANQAQHLQREASNKSKYIPLTFAFLNELVQLALFGFFLACVVIMSYRMEAWRGVGEGGCLAGGVSADDCSGTQRGYRVMLAGTIISLISVLPFLLLNTAALSHLGSHQRKSNVMPPQAATMITTTNPSAASMY